MLLLLASCSSEKKSDKKKILVVKDTDVLVGHDWDSDGLQETIQLAPIRETEQFRELVVFQGTPEGMPKQRILSNRNIVPTRARPGGKLRLLKDKSVLLTIDSSASGRNQDVLTWKFRWKDGGFIVTDLTRDWMDKLDPRDRKSCEVDLRKGKGTLNGKPVKFEPVKVELLDLNREYVPSVCDF